MFGVGAFRDPLTLLALSIMWAAAATALGMLIAAAIAAWQLWRRRFVAG